MPRALLQSICEGLEGEFFGGQPQKALTPLLADLNNIRSAWDWAVEHQDATIFNEMADSIMQGFDLSGLYHDACEMTGKAIESLALLPEPVSQDVTIARGRVMGILGGFLFRMGEYDQAMDWCEKSMQMLEEMRPHIAYAHTLVYAGCIIWIREIWNRSFFTGRRQRRNIEQSNSKWGDMTANSNLAEALIATGKFAEGKIQRRICAGIGA